MLWCCRFGGWTGDQSSELKLILRPKLTYSISPSGADPSFVEELWHLQCKQHHRAGLESEWNGTAATPNHIHEACAESESERRERERERRQRDRARERERERTERHRERERERVPRAASHCFLSILAPHFPRPNLWEWMAARVGAGWQCREGGTLWGL